MGVLKVLKGTLSTLGKKNRNGRIYSKELWENVLNSEYWKDMMANNSLLGECVHPADERSTSDPFEIDANNVSHRIKEAHIEGDRLIGTIEILDTNAGRNIASLIDAGVTIGISARGAGDLNGDEVDPDTYQLKTFDITFRPSDPNARLVPLTESERVKFIPIKESEETDLFTEAKLDYSTNDLGKNIINKYLFQELNNLNKDEKLVFTKSPVGTKITFDSQPLGNIFIIQPNQDVGEPKRYAIFYNKDKGLGYTYVDTNDEGIPKANYKEIATKFLDSINKHKPQGEQQSLDI